MWFFRLLLNSEHLLATYSLRYLNSLLKLPVQYTDSDAPLMVWPTILLQSSRLPTSTQTHFSWHDVYINTAFLPMDLIPYILLPLQFSKSIACHCYGLASKTVPFGLMSTSLFHGSKHNRRVSMCIHLRKGFSMWP